MASILIDGNIVDVSISPSSTKFFGIVPKGKRIDLLQSAVTAAGYKFEAIAAPINSKDLTALAKEIAGIGAATAVKPP